MPRRKKPIAAKRVLSRRVPGSAAREDDHEPFLNAAWFDAILEDRGRSAKSVSEKVFRGRETKDYLQRALKQTREPPPAPRLLKASEIAALAKELCVSLEELFTFGLNIPVEGAVCEVIGRVNAFGVVQKIPPEVSQKIGTPTGLYGVLAVRVDAPNSALGVWHGAYLYYQHSEGPEIRAINRLAYIEIEGEAALIGYVDAVRGPATVFPFGGAEPRRNVTIKIATPILWIRLA